MGIVGKMVPIGLMEAVQNIPESCMTVEVVSMQAELLKIKADVFVKSVQNNANVWSMLLENTEEM